MPVSWGVRLPVLLMALVMFAPAASAGHSKLWGAVGERFEEAGRLPEVSWAGVGQGEVAIPEPPVVANVLEFGATGDGVSDDSSAFQAAIDSAELVGGAVLVPTGNYLIASQLIIDASDVVLRGEGAGESESVLHFPNSLAALFGWVPQWSWSGGLIHVRGSASSEVLSAVSAPAQRGDWTIELEDASGITEGDVVVLELFDDEEKTLGWHLHADQEAPGSCDWQAQIVRRWPVRVASVEGAVLTLAQPLRTDVRAAWNPQVVRAQLLKKVGVERLRIEFPDVPPKEHLEEDGYNGVYFSDGVIDSWVREVTFVNADNPISVRRLGKHLSFLSLEALGRLGHHGIDMGHCHDCLVVDYAIAAQMRHAVTLGHHSSGCAVKRLTSPDGRSLSLDHHRDSPIENVFTDIEAPTDWASGGSWCAGPFSGARSTFWGLSGPLLPPLLWSYIQSNLVGDIALGELGTEETFSALGPWYEHVPELEPKDLHAAQLARRLGQLSLPEDTPDPDASEGADATAVDATSEGSSDEDLGPVDEGALRGAQADAESSVEERPGGQADEVGALEGEVEDTEVSAPVGPDATQDSLPERESGCAGGGQGDRGLLWLAVLLFAYLSAGSAGRGGRPKRRSSLG